MIWREKRVLLIVLGLLLVANALFFLTYRVQYQARLDDLDRRLEDAESALLRARTARLTAEQTVQSYRKIENDVQLVFDEHWSTQSARLVAFIGEVKRLANASGLVPASYAFSRGETREVTTSDGGRRRKEAIGASQTSMTFSVTGTYQQARRLINLLELSRQFVIIESINLSSADGQTLTLNLQLKTLFRDAQKPAASTDRL